MHERSIFCSTSAYLLGFKDYPVLDTRLKIEESSVSHSCLASSADTLELIIWTGSYSRLLTLLGKHGDNNADLRAVYCFVLQCF